MPTAAKKHYLKLSLEKRLALIEEIWKSIEKESPPSWHREIVDRVRANHERKPDQVEDFEKVLADLDRDE